MTKVGVCLAGCGVKDGSEVHESVITILALDRADAEIVFFAPEGKQRYVMNHLTGEPLEEERDVLVESARIARGDIKNIKDITSADFDALIIPGGFGAALNLCDFGVAGDKCSVNPEVERIMKETYEAKKPIGVLCIAPSIAAKVLGGFGVELTIGNDAGTAEKLQSMGAKHVDCAVDNIVVDEKNKIVSTPAYMLGTRISQVATGIEKLVAKVLEMA